MKLVTAEGGKMRYQIEYFRLPWQLFPLRCILGQNCLVLCERQNGGFLMDQCGV